MTIEEKSKTPVGKALYLEFRRNSSSSTFQLILTPAGKINIDGVEKKVDSTVYRRHVSENTPRRQWRVARLRNTNPEEPMDNFDQLLVALNNSWLRSGLNYAISGLADSTKWSIYKQPVVVEVSEEDVKDFYDATTPNALIKRIRKAREALGFEESFYATTPAPTLTPAV